MGEKNDSRTKQQDTGDVKRVTEKMGGGGFNWIEGAQCKDIKVEGK